MTHDYRRNGTTTLFAALNVLDGSVIGRNMGRHRHQEFIRFLNAVERAVPAGKVIHVILDNYAAHKHAKVRRWLIRHPRWRRRLKSLAKKPSTALSHEAEVGVKWKVKHGWRSSQARTLGCLWLP